MILSSLSAGRLNTTRSTPISWQKPSVVKSSGTRKMLIGKDAGSRPASVAIVAELLDDHANAVMLQPVSPRNPTVTIPDRPSGGIGECATDNNRRIRLLERLWPLAHWPELDEFALERRLIMRPDRLHCLDPLPSQLVPGGKIRAVVLDLIAIPTVPNAEQKSSL